MTIGTRIKQLRKEQNITQEQLADGLGITARAISQWECDRTAPDISQLPALANFFNVTTDMLLGVDITRRTEEIKEILEYDRIHFTSKGDNQGSIDHLSGKLKEYPNSPELLDALAASLYSMYFQSGDAFDSELKKQKAEEIIEICNRGIKCSNENSSIVYFKQLLVYTHIFLGNKTKAQEIAFSLPYIHTTRDMLYPRTLDGKEALEAWQGLLLNLMGAASFVIGKIKSSGDYSTSEKIEILNFREKLIKLIIGDEPGIYNGLLFDNSLFLSDEYVKSGNNEAALDELEKAVIYADAYDTSSDSGKFTPCWLSESEHSTIYTIKHNSKTHYEKLMDHIREKSYSEKFNESKRFNNIVSKIQKQIEN